jgi:hypothetical protein
MKIFATNHRFFHSRPFFPLPYCPLQAFQSARHEQDSPGVWSYGGRRSSYSWIVFVSILRLSAFYV